MEKIFSQNPNRINRKTILIPLAKSLNINHDEFKNRTSLIAEIQRLCPASKRCENESDFISLCPVDEIPKNQQFFWSQNKKSYCADIVSLKQYIDSGQTLNPWTIDYATGIESSKNKQAYLKKYDMKNVPNLLDNINKFYSELNIENTQYEIDSNDTNTKRFEIESIGDKCDLYITHLINFIENCEKKIFIDILSHSIYLSAHYYQFTEFDSITTNVLQHLFFQNEILKIKIDLLPNNITQFLDLLKVIESYNNELYSYGIIKYIVLQLEEILMENNLI